MADGLIRLGDERLGNIFEVGNMSLQAGGYVTDVPYVRVLTRELAPAWLDHVALVAGFTPPAREEGFACCDLGCGQGFTATVLATTHQSGRL